MAAAKQSISDLNIRRDSANKQNKHTDKEILEAVKNCTRFSFPCQKCTLKPSFCKAEKRDLMLRMAAELGMI